MTGHNIKYHQNKMEELDGGWTLLPHPPTSAHSPHSIFYVCCSHISTFVRGISQQKKGKIVGIKTPYFWDDNNVGKVSHKKGDSGWNSHESDVSSMIWLV